MLIGDILKLLDLTFSPTCSSSVVQLSYDLYKERGILDMSNATLIVVMRVISQQVLTETHAKRKFETMSKAKLYDRGH